MAKTAKDYEDQAKKEEANGNYDAAAKNFYEAAALYKKDGDSNKADEMRNKEQAALGKMDYGDLQDAAAKLDGHARNLEDKAEDASDSGAYEGTGGSTEMFAAAAAAWEQAAERYVALVADAIKRKDHKMAAALHRKAARDYERAALDLEKAAEDEPDTPKQQVEAKAIL